MAVRDYWIRFGSGSPVLKTGLSPTFITFIDGSGNNVSPPSISEPGSKGLYKFSFEATMTIAFVVDGATTGLNPSDRYIAGVLDPQDILAERIGATFSSFGSTSADPGTVFGFLKRSMEFWEGNQAYTKSSGLLQFFSRGSGSSTLLRERTITDNSSTTIKE